MAHRSGATSPLRPHPPPPRLALRSTPHPPPSGTSARPPLGLAPDPQRRLPSHRLGGDGLGRRRARRAALGRAAARVAVQPRQRALVRPGRAAEPNRRCPPPPWTRGGSPRPLTAIRPPPPRPRCTRYAYGAGVAAQKQPYLNTLSSMHTDQHPVLGFVRSCKKLAAAQRKRDDDAASAAPGRKPIAGAAPGGGGAPNEN